MEKILEKLNSISEVELISALIDMPRSGLMKLCIDLINYKTGSSLRLFDFKSKRLEVGLTLRQVEEKTGISNAYLSQLENGKIKSPSFKVVETLFLLYYAP